MKIEIEKRASSGGGGGDMATPVTEVGVARATRMAMQAKAQVETLLTFGDLDADYVEAAPTNKMILTPLLGGVSSELIEVDEGNRAAKTCAFIKKNWLFTAEGRHSLDEGEYSEERFAAAFPEGLRAFSSCRDQKETTQQVAVLVAAAYAMVVFQTLVSLDFGVIVTGGRSKTVTNAAVILPHAATAAVIEYDIDVVGIFIDVGIFEARYLDQENKLVRLLGHESNGIRVVVLPWVRDFGRGRQHTVDVFAELCARGSRVWGIAHSVTSVGDPADATIERRCENGRVMHSKGRSNRYAAGVRGEGGDAVAEAPVPCGRVVRRRRVANLTIHVAAVELAITHLESLPPDPSVDRDEVRNELIGMRASREWDVSNVAGGRRYEPYDPVKGEPLMESAKSIGVRIGVKGAGKSQEVKIEGRDGRVWMEHREGRS
jgi:hypothetical protein